MAILVEGIWKAKVLNGNYGLYKKDDDKSDDPGLAKVTINVEFIDGPDKGRRASYERIVDGKSAAFVRKTIVAVGWKGVTLNSLKADIEAWIKETGGATTADVKEMTRKSDNSKFSKVDSLGRKPQVLHEATTQDGRERLSDADEAMRQAMEADGASGGGGSNDEDIPFATSNIDAEPSPIARCIR